MKWSLGGVVGYFIRKHLALGHTMAFKTHPHTSSSPDHPRSWLPVMAEKLRVYEHKACLFMSLWSISQTGNISNILFKRELKEVSCFPPVTQIQGVPCTVRATACSFIRMACRLLLWSFIIQVRAVLTALQFHFSS